MSDSCENNILQSTVCSLYQIILKKNASSIKIELAVYGLPVYRQATYWMLAALLVFVASLSFCIL